MERAQGGPSQLVAGPNRLAGALGGAWFCAGGSCLAGVLAATRPGPPLVVLGLWLFLLVRRPAVVALALGCLGLSWWRAEGELDRFVRAREVARWELAGPRRCSLLGQVVSSPVARAALGGPAQDGPAPAGGSGLDVSLVVELSRSDCEGRQLTPGTRVRLSAPLMSGPGLARGDQIAAIAQVAPVRAFHNAGLPSPVPRLARALVLVSGRALLLEKEGSASGPLAAVDHARAHVRQRILATYPAAAAPLARALVLGESDLSVSDGEAFRRSGLLHLLAVSGTHLIIAVLAMVRATSAVLVRVPWLANRYDVRRLPALGGALASLVYADFSGQSGSAVRAALMLLLLLGARASGRRVSGPQALGGSLVLGVLGDPLLGADLSFLLSALATAGLLVLGQPLARLASRGLFSRAPFQQVVEGLAATVSATLFCTPLLSTLAGEMSAMTLLANLVAAPLGELLALPACLLHTVASVSPAVEQGLAVVGSWALLLVRRIAHLSSAMAFAQFEVGIAQPWTLALLACAALGLVAGVRPGRGGRGWVLFALAFTVAVVGWRGTRGWRGAVDAHVDPGGGRLVVTSLDVGQGDAHLLELPDGKVGLIDGGGYATGVPDTASAVLRPVLRAHGVETLDLMVVSHAHPDHITGLIGLAQDLAVRELWHPESPVKSPSLRQLVDLVRGHGGRVLGPEELCVAPGQAPRSFGGAQVMVLLRCAHLFEPAGEPWGPNDGSLVLRLSYGRRSFLFTGDVEARGEQRLLADFSADLAADVLKVAHHGSDTSSSPDLLAAVSARWALISLGVRNRFGHPRPIVLERLRERGIRVLRTDQAGSVSLLTDGQSLLARSAAQPVTLR